MKKLLFLFVCLASVGYVAADSTTVSESQDLILEELIKISAIQDSTYQQRMRAVKARNSEHLQPAEYSVLSSIDENTHKDPIRDGWHLYGCIAFVISLGSLYVSCKTYQAQKNTEKHTRNAPLSAQKSKLADLPRHFYRNIVISSSIIFKYLHESNGVSGNRTSYPSESNLLKLETLPDDIFLPINVDENTYVKMHELRLLFRNYNMEVMVATDHLSKRHLTDETLKEDFDNLLFKPIYLTLKAFDYERLLSPDLGDKNRDSVEKIINEHFKKFKSNISILMRPEQNTYLRQMLTPDFECIKGSIDKKGAIIRSMGELAKISIEDKEALINICKDDSIKKTEDLQKFIRHTIKGKKEFIAWFNENYKLTDTLATLTVEELCDNLQPYFEYLSRESWDFETLLYYMLAVDVAIETDRIGMINHQV